MTDAGDVSFGAETLKGVGANLAMFVFGFAATAYFARELGPAVFGGFYLLLSVVQFANRIPHGFGGACQKRLAETGTPDGELLGLTLSLSLAGTVVAGVVAFVGRDHLVAYTDIPNAPVLGVALFAAISLFLPLQFLLAGTGRFGVTHWIGFGRDVAKRALQFALVALGLGVTGMVVGFAAATFLLLPVLLALLAVRPALPSLATTAYVWEYARYNIPSNVVGKAYTRFDVFLLGWVGLTASVGYYEVALSLTAIATLISGVVMDGILSRVSNLTSRDESIGEILTATLSYTSVIAIPLFVLVTVFADPLVRAVYGPEYLATVPLLVGIGLYRIVQTQREPLDSAVKGMGRPDAVFRISSVTLAVNLILGVALVYTVGPVGVIVATVISELFRCSLLHRALRNAGESVPLLPRALRTQFLGAAAMALVIVPLSVTLPDTAVYQIGVGGTSGILVYTGTLLARDETVSRTLQLTVRTLRPAILG